MMNNPWKLYDALIEGVDPSWKVDYYSQGVTWCEVFSGENSGIAMCMHERVMPVLNSPNLLKGCR